MVTCALFAYAHLSVDAGRDVAENSEAILRTVGEAIGYLQHIQGMVGRALDSQSKRRLVLGHLAALLLALGVRPLAPFTSAFWPLMVLSGCSLMLQTWLRNSCSQVLHAMSLSTSLRLEACLWLCPCPLHATLAIIPHGAAQVGPCNAGSFRPS